MENLTVKGSHRSLKGPRSIALDEGLGQGILILRSLGKIKIIKCVNPQSLHNEKEAK